MPGPVSQSLRVKAVDTPKVLDAITDLVLAYRPKARSGPAVQRKRRRTILQNKKTKKGKRHG